MSRRALGSLFLIALAVRLALLAGVDAPLAEPSAHYALVAGALADGRGLVADALWSYATPPLALPRPAFELWQPLPSLVAAPLATVLEPFLALALAGALAGALGVALVARIAARGAGALGLDDAAQRRVGWATGLGGAVAGGWLTPTLVPDSAVFFGLLVLLTLDRLEPARVAARSALLLGLLLGLAYLARHEAVYVALACALVIGRGAGGSHRLAWLAAGLLAMAVPWQLRNALAFDGASIGQLLDNALLGRPSDVFAYGVRPSLESYLAGAPATLVARWTEALATQLTELALPIAAALPLAVVGTVSLARRQPAALVLLASGGAIFTFDMLLLPVATTSGTFRHAAGPLHGLLIAGTAVGAELAWRQLAARRRWHRPAPLALLMLLVVGLPGLAIGLAGRTEAEAVEARLEHALALLPGGDEAELGAALMSDWPSRVALAAGRPTYVLPAEPAGAWLAARELGVSLVLAFDRRPGDACFALVAETADVSLLRPRDQCGA